MIINIVTNPEQGLDCVIGAWEDVDDINKHLTEPPYVLHKVTLIKSKKEDKNNPYHIDYKRQTKLEF